MGDYVIGQNRKRSISDQNFDFDRDKARGCIPKQGMCGTSDIERVELNVYHEYDKDTQVHQNFTHMSLQFCCEQDIRNIY